MITLFSIPKEFAGHTATIQDNAIGSWVRLGFGCEIILVGDDTAVSEAAARHRVRHEPAVLRNGNGTPILHDVVARVTAMAQHPLLAFVNADIILLDDFLPAIRAVAAARDKFLMVSSRFNCRIERPLSFDPGWEAALRVQARTENRMYPAAGSDIFVYTRGLFGAVPPFAIGRGYWDNWLMHEARRLGACLIDATAAITSVHQDHTYDHIASLPADGENDTNVYETEEGRRNLELAGGRRRLYTAFDATEILTPDGRLLSTWRPPLFRRRVMAWLRREVKARTGRAKPATAGAKQRY